jgi:hypothetical protein
MKFLKNFTLISLLLIGGIPTETKPAPSMPVFVFSATSIIVGGAVFYTALGYIPYLLLSRHDAAKNFVKHQDDISSYSIAIESRKKGETSLIQYITGSNYQQVISDTLTYLQTEPSFPEKFASAEKLFITPYITLYDEKTTQKLLRISIVSPKNRGRTLDYKKIKKTLIARFKIPRIKTYTSPIRYMVGGITLTALSSLFGYFALIPTALISLPLFFKTPRSAHAFVDRQEDIASYSVTVKIKRHVKTIKEQTFVGTDHTTVMNEALLYAHTEQTTGLRSVFKPSITLVDDGENYPLRKIVKKTLPKKPTQLAHYWRRLAHALSEQFIIPNDDSANITHLNRIAYFGLESGAWMLSPYVAVLPFLL